MAEDLLLPPQKAQKTTTSTMSHQVDGTACANPDCEHHDLKIPKRYTCKHCGVYLHNHILKCSVQAPEGEGKIECLPTVGCRRRNSTAFAAAQPESSLGSYDNGSDLDSDDDDDIKIKPSKKVTKFDLFQESDSDSDLVIKSVDKVAKLGTPPIDPDSSDSSIISLLEPEQAGATPKAKPKAKKHANQPKKQMGAKRGPKFGRRKNERTKLFWKDLCEKYDKIKPKMKVSEFLESSESGKVITNSKSNRQSFKKYYRQYEAGTLGESKFKRKRKSVYMEMEEKLVAYLELRAQKYPQEHIGISWLLMREKLMQWKNEMPDQEKYSKFEASSGFIQNVLKRNAISKIILHGEGAEMSKEERLQLASEKNLKQSCLISLRSMT